MTMLSGGSRRRALGVLLIAGMGVAMIGGSLSANAQGSGGLQLPWEPPTTQAPNQSTTTTAAPATTTTTAPWWAPPTAPTTPTTAAPPPAAPPPTTAPPAAGEQPAPEAEPHAGDGGTAPAGAGGFPPELQALTNSIVRTPASNTKALMAALAPLVQLGLTETEAAVVGFGRFPIAGIASYSHDWWYPRFGPGWRLHQGTDIFAAHGTPVRSPVDGKVRVTNGGLGGLSVYVIQPDGTYWYLTHLAGTAEGLATGATVTTGQIVGFVGATGNAAGGPPHLHFEVHPGGGGAVDPKAVLDQFVADALALAPQVVQAYTDAHATGTKPTEVALPAPAPQAVAAALSPRAALLWTTAVSPTGGAVHLAEAEAARVASSIDWAELDTDDAAPSTFDRHLAEQLAAWWVQPLVHPMLQRHLYAG
jgi:murein DD-endopeptidase MepM/ murein hydrolase activator NlpD